MLPPVDPAVLQRNPNFDILYKDLCTRKLNPNGSTRETKKQRVHDEIRRALFAARTSLLTTQILIDTLSDLPSKASDLPPELHSLIDIATAQLRGQISASDREILSADLDAFVQNSDIISEALSALVTRTTSYLCSIADPLDPPLPKDLCARASALQTDATLTLPDQVQTAHLHLTHSFALLLATHSTLVTTAIAILEQTQQGALARHTRSSADLLHARSVLLGLQAKIHTYSHPPPAEFVDALRQFKRSQGSREKALRDREALATRELELYGRAGERGMRELARRKQWIVGEVQRVEAEVSKLERGEGVVSTLAQH